MQKSKRKNKPRNVVRAVPKKGKKLDKEQTQKRLAKALVTNIIKNNTLYKSLRKSKPKRAITRVKPMYTCISKNYHPKEFIREKINQHGAKDDVKEIVEAVELVFSYQNHMNRREDTPRVLHAHFSFCTTDTQLAAQYTIGQEYSELPK